MENKSKGKGKGKGEAHRAPPKAVDKEEQQRRAAARKAEADAELKATREAEAKQYEFAARVHTYKTRSIYGVPWETAQMVHQIGHGTKHSGVFAALLGEDEVVCVREQDSVTELVAQAVANSMGVRVAQFRMVHEGDPELGIMNAALRRVDPKGKEKDKSILQVQALAERHGHEKKPDAVEMSKGVLEYIPGLTLDLALRANDPTEDMFLAIGRLCALDLVLNNMDRVPLTVWQAELGNFGNIMVGEDGSVAGIDQQVNCIGQKEGVEEYVASLRRLVIHLMRRDYAHITIKQMLAKVAQAILIVCEVEVPREVMLALARGMREGLVSFEQSWSSGALSAALAEAAREGARVAGQVMPHAWSDWYAKACVSFVQAVAEGVGPLVRDSGEKAFAA